MDKSLESEMSYKYEYYTLVMVYRTKAFLGITLSNIKTPYCISLLYIDIMFFPIIQQTEECAKNPSTRYMDY